MAKSDNFLADVGKAKHHGLTIADGVRFGLGLAISGLIAAAVGAGLFVLLAHTVHVSWNWD